MSLYGIGLDVYAVVLGELVVSLGLIAWALRRNRRERGADREPVEPRTEA